MILVGATAIGIGSAVYYQGLDVFRQVCGELEDYMERHDYGTLEEFRGRALTN
jgi:dihydroorotate dehydrogenase (NAD+) catalytic subunit